MDNSEILGETITSAHIPVLRGSCLEPYGYWKFGRVREGILSVSTCVQRWKPVARKSNTTENTGETNPLKRTGQQMRIGIEGLGMEAIHKQSLYFSVPLTAQWQGHFLTSEWLNYPPLIFPRYYLLKSISHLSCPGHHWAALLGLLILMLFYVSCFSVLKVCPGESPCLFPLWTFVQAS